MVRHNPGLIKLVLLTIVFAQPGRSVVCAEEPASTTEEAGGTETPRPVRNLLGRINPLQAVNVDSDFSITHGVRFTNEEAGFDLHLGGRFFIDAVRYSEDRNSNLSETLGFRDARLETEARFGSDWSSRWSAGVTVDDEGSYGLDLDDLYVRYLGFAPYELTFGRHSEPFSLEEMTSGRRTTFMERALPNAFAPGTNLGLSVRTHGEWWAGAAGIFASDHTSEVDLGRGISGRFVMSPKIDTSDIVHLGGSISLRDTTKDDNIFFFRRPEVGLADFRYVDTGRILDAESVIRLGLEGAYVRGPYSVQGEIMSAWVGRQAGSQTASFDGLYVHSSWMVTGETRPYIREIGNFGPIDSKYEYGAVELAARYSRIDLTSHDITGGAEQNITLGVNWYVRPQARLMANYVFVFADNQADGNGTLIGGDSPQMFQVRLQVSF
jgi:phosphate-selective porin OprO/OprP